MKLYLSIVIIIFYGFINAKEYFVIDRYEININVLESNVYEVTEILDVSFSQPRHGIFRYLETKYRNYPVEITDIEVRGHQARYTETRNKLIIIIGSEDEYVEGNQRYVIRYKYDVGDDRNSNMDEFYHNLIGLDWDTDISEAKFSIQMPFDFDSSKLNFTSGTIGSVDNSNVEWKVEDKTITGSIKSPLGSYEGLTVALPLPEGYWINAKKHISYRDLFYQFLGYPYYLIIILISAFLWFKHGRDKKLYPSVEFYPPENFSPAEIGYIIDGRVDNNDVTSLIIYWAEKGFLDIEQSKGTKSLTLIKKKDPDSSFKDYEKRMFRALFKSGGDKVNLDDLVNSFYKTIMFTAGDIERSFTKDPQKKIYESNNKKYTFLIGLMSFFPLIMISFEVFLTIPEGTISGNNAPPFIMGSVFGLFLVIPMFLFAYGVTTPYGYKQKSIKIMLIITSLVLAGLSYLLIAFLIDIARVSLEKYIAALVSTFISSVFMYLMSKRTPYGDQILEKVLGFRKFIDSAEKSKLEELFDSNPSYFYNILPYAIVMGLSSKWSKHFEGLSISKPDWYIHYDYYDDNDFSTTNFTDHFNSSFNEIVTKVNSSPSSSSSGGSSSSSGGSSGGGSGGGGGGSW
ncbi:MAG: DUF2207 domain-containing protein [Candidatus Delongbacteria bacterium]|nr:DUF2207 domain-containing protein [Candidatus Delongbacteria bacterium]MBN2836353.1 DUF2207 domain-containing protein [Candidatus Delongbacteria bacterium]